jgi:hypothetical protein
MRSVKLLKIPASKTLVESLGQKPWLWGIISSQNWRSTVPLLQGMGCFLNFILYRFTSNNTPHITFIFRSPQDGSIGTRDSKDSSAAPLLTGNRRPSSPPAIPGLPMIEIRRPSALSQFEFGYFVNSPEFAAGNESDCAPLLLSGGGTQNGSRKSSIGKYKFGIHNNGVERSNNTKTG